VGYARVHGTTSNVRDLLECHISFYLSFGETERLQGLGMQFLVIFS